MSNMKNDNPIISSQTQSKVVKKKRVDHPSRASEKKSYKLLDEYKEYFSQRVIPVTEQFLERLGSDLIAFAKTEKRHLRVEWFFAEKNIPLMSMYRWMEKYESFKRDCDQARYIFGMRREAGAMWKELDNSFVAQTQGHYDPVWDQQMKLKAKLKADAGESANKTVIVMSELDFKKQN